MFPLVSWRDKPLWSWDMEKKEDRRKILVERVKAGPPRVKRDSWGPQEEAVTSKGLFLDVDLFQKDLFHRSLKARELSIVVWYCV